jgi:hypothetical protein
MQRYLSASPDLWFDVTHVVTTEDIAAQLVEIPSTL